jgi:hypothetical protein
MQRLKFECDILTNIVQRAFKFELMKACNIHCTIFYANRCDLEEISKSKGS